MTYYIYEKDLNTNKSTFYRKVNGEQQAKAVVKELNLDSLFEDKFYYLGENPFNYDD